MPIVTTGQLTIVDTNDARSITAALVANGGTQQVYTKDESIISYTPSWVSTPLIITPQISVGGMTSAQAWAALTNKTFSLTAGGAALTTASTSTSFVNNSDTVVGTPFTVTHAANGSGTASTFQINANLKESVGNFTLFFDADFVDPTTGLSTHITCQITLNTVKTGTNAVFITLRGTTAFEEATGSTKNVIAVAADLVRSSGVDTTGLTYKWYEAGGGTQITTSLSGYATKYGLKSNTTTSAPTGSNSDLGVGLPASGAGNSNNTLVIAETAVSDIGIYKVEITDSESKTYSAFFTVYDVSDPYECQILSTSGDKLQNGQGSTTLTPLVYYGAAQVSDLTGWTFTWYFYDRNGKRGAFVNTAKIAAAGGGTITANTTGASASFSSTAITAGMFVAGEIIKCVKPDGSAFFYEAGATSVAGSVTIRTPATNTWLSFTDFPAPSASTDFVGGKIFGCTTNGTRSTSGNASVVLSGDDVDVKSRILVEANRP